MQPALLVQFLGTAASEPPRLDAVENLAGTRTFADMIDNATRRAVDAGKIDFAASAEIAIARLTVAELEVTVTTLQGPILLADYLVTRCVEAVVHGGDLVDPVDPDPQALGIVAAALTSLLARRDAALVAVADALPPLTWVAVATGREPAPDALGDVVPLMA
jgi:hypothetical protein